MLLKAFGTEISVGCPEFRGGRFSEAGNIWDFPSGPESLSSLGSVSAFGGFIVDNLTSLCPLMSTVRYIVHVASY